MIRTELTVTTVTADMVKIDLLNEPCHKRLPL